ncbi:Gp37-like protein [Microbacterium sp. A1-JK]|uniref:Gp37-like protein n=1 Tax=Microbacterium sp. A1-JK TaxID=3177516 RepID=UPI003885364F
MDGHRFVIYDSEDNYELELSGLEASSELPPNQIPTASFVLDDDDSALAAVTAPGARCGVWFRGIERFRGRIESTPGEGPQGFITANIEGDIRKLWDWHGRQVPGAALDAQASEYRVYTGKTESVVKAALAENFARLGVPWTVAPSLDRGVTVRVEFRMHPLADKLIPILDAAGLILTLEYTETGVVVDVREPDTVPGVLTLETGIPDAYSFGMSAPTATRVIVGGRGEGVEREFLEVRDDDREAEWGDIIESFTDARNTEEGSDLSVDGLQALAEGAPRVSITTDLVETERFMFGSTYLVGDLVHVKVGPVDTTQRLSVSITESADSGVEVTPRIGEIDDSADIEVRLAQQLAALARGVRDQGRR